MCELDELKTFVVARLYVSFSFPPPQAQNPDELTIVENEELEMLGEGDGDGWVQARNYKGEVS